MGLEIFVSWVWLGAVMGACSQVGPGHVAVAEACPHNLSQAECRNEVYVATNVSEAFFLDLSKDVSVIAAELEGQLHRRDDDLRTFTFRFVNRDDALLFIETLEHKDYVSVVAFKPDVVLDSVD